MSIARRVVITGLGLVTPLGVGVPLNWQRLIKGDVATQAISDPRFCQLPCRVAAYVPKEDREGGLNSDTCFTSSELRSMTQSTVYALVAAREALKDAGWNPTEAVDKERTGVAVGLGMVDLEDIIVSGKLLDEKYSRVSPFFVPRILTNMAAGRISMEFGFGGPNHSVSTACATGCHAIGDGFRFIKHSDADVMVCGGTEASISPLGIAGFCRLRALSTKFNDRPEAASRPFDKQRDGFVMGEGAGIVVLEELKHAVDRKAHIYGEVLGYGLSGDAHHITAPQEDGQGAMRAMKSAIKESNIPVETVTYVNAHATSTPLGDEIELQAIHSMFGGHSKNIFVSSTKGAVGHLLGAAGAVETIYTIMAVQEGIIPPTANLEVPCADVKVNLVARVGQAWVENDDRHIALCNSFGFGGTNACLCVASFRL